MGYQKGSGARAVMGITALAAWFASQLAALRGPRGVPVGQSCGRCRLFGGARVVLGAWLVGITCSLGRGLCLSA